MFLRRRVHPPAADRAGGRPSTVSGSAPAEENGGNTTVGRRELQAAPSNGRDRPALAEHGSQRPAAQRVLHRPQHVGFVAGVDDYEPRRIEAEGGEAGRVKVGGRDAGVLAAPYHAAGRAGEPGQQQRGEAGYGGAAVAPDQFVQAAPRQATPRQDGIDRGDPEG